MLSSFIMVKEGYYFGLPPLIFRRHHSRSPLVDYRCGLISLALFCLCFFRDPTARFQLIPTLSSLPADGRVVVITPEENAGRLGTASASSSPSGTFTLTVPPHRPITQVKYLPGKFLAAWDPRASTQNEQNIFTLVTPGGEIEFKANCRLIARRVRLLEEARRNPSFAENAFGSLSASAPVWTSGCPRTPKFRSKSVTPFTAVPASSPLGRGNLRTPSPMLLLLRLATPVKDRMMDQHEIPSLSAAPAAPGFVVRGIFLLRLSLPQRIFSVVTTAVIAALDGTATDFDHAAARHRPRYSF